jgi:hypothetical protein
MRNIKSCRKINESEMIGNRYGKLIVIKETEKHGKNRMFQCKCDCGNLTITQMGGLRSGHTKSCGCYHDKVPLKGFNNIIIHKDYAEMIIESNKFGVVSTFFDLSHLDEIKKYTRWYLSSKKYVETMLSNRKIIKMHTLFCKTDKPFVDHKDGNTLNNRDNNLRGATVQENCRNQKIRKNNKTGCNGVHKFGDKWRARINIGIKNVSLGLFNNLDDAIKARKEAEIKYFGEFSSLYR